MKIYNKITLRQLNVYNRLVVDVLSHCEMFLVSQTDLVLVKLSAPITAKRRIFMSDIGTKDYINDTVQL